MLTESLFLVVGALDRHGLTPLLARLTGTNTLRTAAVSAGVSNAVNNLPAYLALERTVPAGETPRLLAVLIGTNAGPLVLLSGSLATLLWRERCRARGLHVSALAFARVGLVGVPLVLLAAWAALAVG